MKNTNYSDIVVMGGGMVGLSLAYQILERLPGSSVTVIDKESQLGSHSSGRNSGVLHAGIYYAPNTLKAKVCVSGARRLRQWCDEEDLPILQCGKVITPQTNELDSQLDLLLDRGHLNGAEVYLIDEKEFRSRVPDGYTASGRALWSPNTCVVNPKMVMERLENRLRERGVSFLLSADLQNVDPEKSSLELSLAGKENYKISYGYLFNASGLQTDLVAKKFHVGMSCVMLPFKGLYWKLKRDAPFRFTTNLYPVPDLNVPFLGVHVTPSLDGSINLGPTAIPALGRENYTGLKGVDPIMTLQSLAVLAGQWWKNSNGFRQYAREQAFQGFKPLFLKAAQAIIPELQNDHLIPSQKVGIRAQLFDHSTGNLVNDFRLEHVINTTHVLNAMSPAFTASFALADLILDQSSLSHSK